MYVIVDDGWGMEGGFDHGLQRSRLQYFENCWFSWANQPSLIVICLGSLVNLNFTNLPYSLLSNPAYRISYKLDITLVIEVFKWTPCTVIIVVKFKQDKLRPELNVNSNTRLLNVPIVESTIPLCLPLPP